MSSRRVLLEGAVNLRDFGGYVTAGGGTVCRGRLYRSGTLAHLSERARRDFAALGVRLVCDLRRPEEQAEEPTPFPPETLPRLSIPIDPGSAVSLRRELGLEPLDLKRRIDFMVAINRELARDHAQDYARMFEALLALEDGAFLVHCSAGKDRTGFACALILHALGVAEETVLEDYLLTNEFLDYERHVLRVAQRFEPHGIPDRESVMALAGVRPEYLKAAYEAIESEFEGVESYIERAVGLDAAARDVLKRRFVA